MAKFKSKVVEIEAKQLTPDNVDELAQWCKSQMRTLDNRIKISTLEGVMIADFGDWIIMGTEGEFYPCKPQVFEKKYEAI